MQHAREPLVWAGGEHPFRLGIGELRALEERSNAGCAVVLTRLLSGQWKIDDVIGPIRLGLIGGGMSETEAKAKLEAGIETANIYALAVTATEVLRRAMLWDGDDRPGEAEAGTATAAPRSPTAERDGQPTTVGAPSSGSRQETSTT